MIMQHCSAAGCKRRALAFYFHMRIWNMFSESILYIKIFFGSVHNFWTCNEWACVCGCVRVRVCACACVYVCMCVCVFLFLFLWLCACLFMPAYYAGIYICVFVRVTVYIYMYMHVCMYVCLYECMYVLMSVRGYVYISTYACVSRNRRQAH